MTRSKVLWIAIGIVTVCSLSIASLGRTQPGNDRSGRRFQPGQSGLAQQRKGGCPDRARDGGQMMNWATLDLSEEQREQVQQISREFQLNTTEARQKLQFAQQDVRDELRQEPVDQAKVESLWADIRILKQQLGEETTNRLLAIKGIVTPEQLAELQERETRAQELRALKAEYRELLFASGETDAEQLQQLQEQMTEKEIARQKERTEKLDQRWADLRPEQRENMQQGQGNRRKGNRPER